MSEFSNILRQFIHEKNIKVYSLIKYCNIDRSTMYKIINGKRNPPSKDIVEKIGDFMHLTPLEYACFEEAYQITKIGAENYYRRKNAQDFLMNFPDNFTISSPVSIPDFSSFQIPENIPACAAIQTHVELNYVLRSILLKESQIKKGKIALFLQPDCEYLFSLLSNLNLGHSLEIQQIFCLNNDTSLTPEHESYNLNYFQNIFPLYLRNTNSKIFYFYDNIHSHFFNLNVLPYFVLTSQYAVSFSSDYQYGIFYTDPTVVSQFWNLFHSFQEKCTPFFQVFTLTPDKVHMIQNLALNTAETYLLQPEPCMTPFISKEILKSALLENLPDRNHMLALLSDFFSANTKNLPGMHVYFTESGIRRFIQTRRLKEIPEDFYRPFLPQEQVQMLESLLPYCYQGLYRMIKAPLNQLPINLHLCINNNMGYFSFDNIDNQATYLMFNETGLLSVFLDYLQSLEDACFYTPEETGDFIKAIIEELQQQSPVL